MKNSIFLFIYILYTTQTFSQKHDNIWVVGQGDLTMPPNSIINFQNGSPQITGLDTAFRFKATDASISDSLGNLLFYTNGIDIWNKNHQIMENGDTLVNCETVFNYINGLAAPQGAMVLPKPSSKDKFLLFLHFNDGYPDVFLHPLHWYVSEIDMSYNNGLGKVTQKSNIILVDTMAAGQNAVKHANGRDWWIVSPIYGKNYFHLFLVTPDSIIDKGVQIVPAIQDDGVSIFSPDGKYFVTAQGYKDVNVYGFDRCNGKFARIETFDNQDLWGVSYCSISPNSRYLYLSAVPPTFEKKLYQYDLSAANIKNSQTEVADGTLDSALFVTHRLAPDGKIYINHYNRLHVIHNPDLQGVACNVELKAITLPSRNADALPFYPNYRLGAEVGSACDTLSSVSIEKPQIEQVSVYPNPASDMLTIQKSKGQTIRVEINTLLGQSLARTSLADDAEQATIMLGNISAGIYYVYIYQGDTLAKVEKLIIQK